MRFEDLSSFAVPAIILIIAVASKLVRSAKPSGAATAAPSAGAPDVQPDTTQRQRIAGMLAEMQRRGITPPATLLRVAAAEGVSMPVTARPPAPPPPPTPPPSAAVPLPPVQPQMIRSPRSAARAQPTPPIPAIPSLDAPSPAASGKRDATRRMLADAFSDPAHARNAVILLEILAPPVSLRR